MLVNNFFKPVLVVSIYLLLIIVWELFLDWASIPKYIFPKPTDIFETLITSFTPLLQNLIITGIVACIGFIAGCCLAFACALILVRVDSIAAIALPVIIGIQAIPIIALAPYFLIWFGPGLQSRVMLTTLVVYLPALLITMNALRERNPDALKLYDSVRASENNKFWLFSVPSAAAAIASAMDVTASLSVIGAIVAELAGSANGVGFVVIQASYSLDTPRVFAILFLAAVMSYCLFSGVRVITASLRHRFSIRYADI